MSTYLVLALTLTAVAWTLWSLARLVVADGLGRRPAPRHVERDWASPSVPSHPYAA